MRALTAKQKKLLDKYIVEYKEKNKPLYTVEDLDINEWSMIEVLNDTEVLWQNANRYISDKQMEMLHGSK